jgi:hypothetical protein
VILKLMRALCYCFFAAREQWARENPEWAEAVAKSKPLRAVGADLHLNPGKFTFLDSVLSPACRYSHLSCVEPGCLDYIQYSRKDFRLGKLTQTCSISARSLRDDPRLLRSMRRGDCSVHAGIGWARPY